ncbi:MAG: rhodanese-related sulfurtransferase [Beijerinckiaceae bacterium]
MIEIAAFYKFERVQDPHSLQKRLRALCEQHHIKGIILIAPEGINGTITSERDNLAAALVGLRREPGFHDLEHKSSFAEQRPFHRMKVRLKKEIVTIGDTSIDPSVRVGTYVEPKDWNRLIEDPEVLVIDTRNDFEVAVGTFAGAIDPKTRSFGAFPAFIRNNFDPAKHKKIAMFCTGGIRCEKASSFMLGEGFEDVFHLKGGILNYLEKVPEDQSLWRGGCFVFDERVAVGHGLAVQPVRMCLSCDSPIGSEAMQSADYEDGVSCPSCANILTGEQKASARERQRQIRLAMLKGKSHLGPKAS